MSQEQFLRALTPEEQAVLGRLSNADNDLMRGEYQGGPEQYAKDVVANANLPHNPNFTGWGGWEGSGFMRDITKAAIPAMIAAATFGGSLGAEGGATSSPVSGGSVTGTDLGLLGGGSSGAAGTVPALEGTSYGLGGGAGTFGSASAGGTAAGMNGAGMTAATSTSAVPGSALTSGGAGLSSMGGGTGLTFNGVGAGGGMSLIDYGKAGLDFLKDNKAAGYLLGGLLGAAAGGDTTTSASRDPWGPAQPYLKSNLERLAQMQDYYTANPFSNEQKQAYQGYLDANANAMANVGGLLANANAFGKSSGGRMPAMTGLLSGITAPQVDWTKYANIGKKV